MINHGPHTPTAGLFPGAPGGPVQTVHVEIGGKVPKAGLSVRESGMSSIFGFGVMRKDLYHLASTVHPCCQVCHALTSLNFDGLIWIRQVVLERGIIAIKHKS